MRRSSALAFVLALFAATPAQAAWPGDNGRVLFTSANRLYTMDPAGGAFTRLVDRNEQQAQAAWSPDGSKVAYRVGPDGDTEIWVVDADGSNPHQITTTPNVAPCSPCYSSQPAWSPDGRQIVFRTDRANGDGDVWIMGSDGSGPRPLVTTPGDERYPALSPDGTRLVFRTGDPPEIWVAHADGTDAVQITHNSLFDSAPAWSPDSSRLAFERGDPGADVPSNASYPSMELWTMAADGSDQRQVTSNGVHDEGPAWAPDGSGQLLFTRDDGQNSDLYIGERRLTDAATLEESPDWQAIPRAAAPSAPSSSAPPSGSPATTTAPVTTITSQRAALLVLRSARVRVSRTGRFVVRLRCNARCSGTLRVSRHGTTLARTRFSAQGARTLNVRLRLKASTLRRLRRARRLGVEVRLLRGRLTLLAPR